jgi:hypothetical protein
LPKRWRKPLPFSDSVNWPRAVTLSGFAELLLALAALLQWYLISMTAWVNRGLEVALSGKAGNGITDHAIGAMALLMWVNHPLTWLLGYFGVEGAVRMCGAAFSDNLLGTLPLFLLDKAVGVFLGRSKTAQEVPGVASSFVGAISAKMLESSVPKNADEISYQKSATEEIMEIRASRRKPDWDPPRPFRYRLRRLSAGVPGRNVLVYDPGDAVVAGKRQ